MWKNNLVPYVYKKRDIYYFSRRVPKDLEDCYKASKITLFLRTKSTKVAKTKSASLASQLDEEWLTLRWRRNDSPLRRFLHEQALYEARRQSIAPLMSESKDMGREVSLVPRCSNRLLIVTNFNRILVQRLKSINITKAIGE